jgi:hypothetical protein
MDMTASNETVREELKGQKSTNKRLTKALYPGNQNVSTNSW